MSSVIEDLRSIACLWEVHFAAHKNHNKSMKPVLLNLRKLRQPQRSVLERAQKSNSIQEGWVCCFVTTQ